jgi:hypothetical protein
MGNRPFLLAWVHGFVPHYKPQYGLYVGEVPKLDGQQNSCYADFAAREPITTNVTIGVNRIPVIDPSQGGEGPSLYTNLLFSGYT